MRELNFATEPSLRHGLKDVYLQFQEELERQSDEAVRELLNRTLEIETDLRLQAHKHERSEDRIDYRILGPILGRTPDSKTLKSYRPPSYRSGKLQRWSCRQPSQDRNPGSVPEFPRTDHGRLERLTQEPLKKQRDNCS